MVPLVQFKKREKHPWRSDTFRRCFSRFLDSVNGTKSRKALHMVMIVRIQFDQLVYIDWLAFKNALAGGFTKSDSTPWGISRSSQSKVFLEILQNSQENICARVSFFNNVADLRPAILFKKETLAQVFSGEYCKISKNTFSYITPPLATSVLRIVHITSKCKLMSSVKAVVVMRFIWPIHCPGLL